MAKGTVEDFTPELREICQDYCAQYGDPPRVAFWYEAAKPQRYCHERIAA